MLVPLLFQFLAELTLIDMETYLKYLPSVTAAASLCLARFSLGLEPWVRDSNKVFFSDFHLE